MKIAYLILAHDKPNHLARLIGRLNNEHTHFFIHIDRKKQLKPFENLLSSFKNLNFVKKRENGNWGDIGLVKATINGLTEIYFHSKKFERIVLLSGQDYPIKPNREILDFFKKNKDFNFIQYTPFPVESLTYRGLHRIKHRSYNILGKRQTYIPTEYSNNLNFKGKMINAILYIDFILRKERIVPYNLKSYYGSQWWSITGETCESLIHFLSANILYLKFHEKSLIPDEMFFQTLILKLKKKE